MYDLRVTVFERGSGGEPGATPLVSDLSGVLSSIEYSIVNQGGFESATLQIPAATHADLDAYSAMLGCHLEITGPDARVAWEGRIVTVEATLGQVRVSRSLEGMANRVKTRYTTVNGVQGVSSTVSDATSQATYGVRDLVESLATATSTEAGYIANARLSERRWPRTRIDSEVATGDMGATDITLIAAGWYYALDDLVTSSTSTTLTTTTTQVTSLLTDYNSTNDYFSTATTNITASGITASEVIDLDSTYRSKIETLLTMGNGVNPYAWGVYDGRILTAKVWAGATPSTISYRRSLAGGAIYDTVGALVAPWNVRPDAMAETIELRDLAPASTEIDVLARFYVARVRFRADESGIGVTLEPSDSDALSARLARIESLWT